MYLLKPNEREVGENREHFREKRCIFPIIFQKGGIVQTNRSGENQVIRGVGDFPNKMRGLVTYMDLEIYELVLVYEQQSRGSTATLTPYVRACNLYFRFLLLIFCFWESFRLKVRSRLNF